MKIKSLWLKDFRGYPEASFDFNREFTCLFGPNGIGKTTALEAINLLCTDLDFSAGGLATKEHEELKKNGFNISFDENIRLKQFLRKNIRVGQETFTIIGMFEHDGKEYEVVLTESGFRKNEIRNQDWWRRTLCHFTKFDTELGNFHLHVPLWDEFASTYEAVTGIKLEDPEYYNDEIFCSFTLVKPNGKIKHKQCSAGERKIARSLSQIISMDKLSKPNIALIDNIEMHVHYKRHLAMVQEVKRIFSGVQIISTTHSTIIMDSYPNKNELIDVESLNIGNVI